MKAHRLVITFAAVASGLSRDETAMTERTAIASVAAETRLHMR